MEKKGDYEYNLKYERSNSSCFFTSVKQAMEKVKGKHIMLISGILVGVIAFFIFQQPSSLGTPLVHLVDYEWDIYVESWEHESVEANITIFNSGDGDANFTIEIGLYDDDKYFGNKMKNVELRAGEQKTVFMRVWYELLVNHHKANRIEIIGGVYGDDGYLADEPYFHEFSMKRED